MASRASLSRFSPLAHSARSHLRNSIRPHPQFAITTATTTSATATGTATTNSTSSPCLAGRPFSSSPIPRAFKVPPPPPRSTPPPTASTSPSPSSSSTSSPSEPPRPPRSRVETQPHYRLSFTCSPCNTKSTHNISKQGYHRGSVLVTCPGCRNRHVIADHLNIFGDRSFTIEDLMREKGQLVKKGTLGEDGDIEFWEDDAESAAASPASQDGFRLASQQQQQEQQQRQQQQQQQGGGSSSS